MRKISLDKLLGWMQAERPDWQQATAVKMLQRASTFNSASAKDGLSPSQIYKIYRGEVQGRDWEIDEKDFTEFCLCFAVDEKDSWAMLSRWAGERIPDSLKSHTTIPVPYTKLQALIGEPYQDLSDPDPNYRDGMLHFRQGDSRVSRVDHTPFTKRSVFVEQVKMEFTRRNSDGHWIKQTSPYDRPRNYIRVAYSGENLENQTLPGAIGVAMLLDTARVALTLEFRPIARTALFELPRGFPDVRDRGNGDNAVRREVKEELGITPMIVSDVGQDVRTAYQELGTLYTDSGALSDKPRFAMLVSESMNTAHVTDAMKANKWQLATVNG